MGQESLDALVMLSVQGEQAGNMADLSERVTNHIEVL